MNLLLTPKTQPQGQWVWNWQWIWLSCRWWLLPLPWLYCPPWSYCPPLCWHNSLSELQMTWYTWKQTTPGINYGRPFSHHAAGMHSCTIYYCILYHTFFFSFFTSRNWVMYYTKNGISACTLSLVLSHTYYYFQTHLVCYSSKMDTKLTEKYMLVYCRAKDIYIYIWLNPLPANWPCNATYSQNSTVVVNHIGDAIDQCHSFIKTVEWSVTS